MVRNSTGAAVVALWSAVSLSWAQQAQPVQPAPAPTPAPLVAPAAQPEAAPAVSTEPAPTTETPAPEDNAPPSMEVPADSMPPALDAPAAVPAAQVPPAPDRPFMARFAGLESGVMVASLLGGWAVAGLVGMATVLGASSWGSGRVQWDFPRTMVDMLLHSNQTTEGSRIFTGQNAGVMMGSLIFATLAGAVLAAGAATLVAMLSQDWETSMGPAAAAGVLAGAICAGLGGALFVASLAVPFPPLWLLTFSAALAVGVVVPPVAVIVGALFTKKARAVPGGLINTLLQAMPVNPMARPGQ
jgi:hypothetical protein